MIRQEVALRPGVNGTLCEAEAFLEWMYMEGKRMSWQEESCGEEMGKEQRQGLLGRRRKHRGQGCSPVVCPFFGASGNLWQLHKNFLGDLYMHLFSF